MKRLFSRSITMGCLFFFNLCEICFAQEDFFSGTIKYYDKLKTCSPYTFTHRHPLLGDFITQNIIKGKVGDKCHVESNAPHNFKTECMLSPNTIKLMTSEKRYEEARKKELNISTGDPDSIEMTKECKLIPIK